MTTQKEPSKYFDFHYKALRILGIGWFHHPSENNFDNYPTIFYKLYGFLCTTINIIGYTVSETFFAVKVWRDNRETALVFLAFTMVGVHIIATIKILIIIKNNRKIQNIVHVLEIKSGKYKRDPDVLQRTLFSSKIVTGFFFGMGELTVTCMAIYSIIIDFDRKNKIRASNFTLDIPRDIPFTAYVPWETDEDLLWAAGFVYSVFGMYWMGTSLIICDTMIASIMTHISGQFEMVQKNIEDISDSAIEMLINKSDYVNLLQYTSKLNEIDVVKEYNSNMLNIIKSFSDEEISLAMMYCLKEAIEYHEMIIGITRDLQNAYSNAFLLQTISSLYVIGLILVQTAQDVSNVYSLRFFNTLGFLLSILWQLFSQTYSANEITLQAEKIYNSAYNTKWYLSANVNKKIGRTIMLLQHKAQRPVCVTAGKLAPMSNALFVAIVRSAYKIFTVITTTMSGK